MRDLLAGFVTELRAAGLPVSLTEHLDAARAVRHVPLEDRPALKAALGATLVKSSGHWPTFETAFEIFFSGRSSPGRDDAQQPGGRDGGAGAPPGGSGAPPGSPATSGDGAHEAMSADTLAAMLLRAMRGGDAGLAAAAARHAVDRYGGMEPGRPVAGTYYVYRTLRRLDLEGLLERLLAAERDEAHLTPLEQRLLADEYRARLAAFRKAVEAEVRKRLVQDRGPAALARAARRPLPEDVDVMHASREELASLSRALHPLSRKLAVRLARRRRHRRRGPLDVRATVRRSLSTGGVPAEPRFRHKNPSKPEIVVIADVSGSVASFARFTLQLVYAISTQFSKVRSFVFVDGIDEVTGFFERGDELSSAVRRVVTDADVVRFDGHSDYGQALEEFARRWGEDLTSRMTVLVLGDARNNYHASGAWVLDDLHRRTRHVYWLNPEPRQYWGSGDSIIDEYAPFCDAVVECRTLRQLEGFVAGLA